MSTSRTAAVNGPAPGVEPLRGSWLRPVLGDALAIALFLWLIFFTAANGGLIADTDTGQHILTGEYILSHGSPPHEDFYSFTRPGAPWYAWEWLSGVLLAAVWHSSGWRGIVVVSASMIVLTMMILLRLIVRRAPNALLAILLLHVAIGAASVHFLARPHLFTFLFMAVSLVVFEHDREHPSWRLYLLIPLAILWTNLHGGFLALPITASMIGAGALLSRDVQQTMRYTALALGSLAASLVNPYGWMLHVHLWEYIRAGWIRELVEEFQAPRFQTAAGIYVGIVIALGVAAALWQARQRRFVEAVPIAGWCYATLRSVRHVMLLVLFVLPAAGELLYHLWTRVASRSARGSLAQLFDEIGRDHAPGLRRNSIWSAVLPLLLLVSPLGLPFPTDFPEQKYPIAMTARHASLWADARVFTRDSWATYLSFHFRPKAGVFLDGRTDFFGETLARDYANVLNGGAGWQNTLDRYRVDTILAPTGSGIGKAAADSPNWKRIDGDDQSALYVRR